MTLERWRDDLLSDDGAIDSILAYLSFYRHDLKKKARTALDEHLAAILPMSSTCEPLPEIRPSLCLLDFVGMDPSAAGFNRLDGCAQRARANAGSPARKLAPLPPTIAPSRNSQSDPRRGSALSVGTGGA
jgi:hypothetical protein